MSPALLVPAALAALVSTTSIARAAPVAPVAPAALVADEPQSLAELLAGTEAQRGLLDFHRKPGTLYLELPAGIVGAPLGFAAVQVGGRGDFSVRGDALDTQLVRWERVGEHVQLVKQNLEFRADAADPLAEAVEATFPDSPVFTAPLLTVIDAEPPLLVDAAALFGPGLAELLPKDSGFEAADPVLEQLSVFADNVVARVRYVLKREPGPSPQQDSPGSSSGGGEFSWSRWQTPRRLPDARAAALTVDYHLFRLPDDGYLPRAADPRLGGMLLSYKDYTGADERDTLFRHLLRRWDVRPRDPGAALSPPVEPITFVMDRSIPVRWRDAVREATLWWNEAFLAVGISDAIVVLDPPDDPAFDAADIAHSVIYWDLTDDLVFSGMAGPFHVDPRTGEVLKSNVYLNGEFFSFAQNRYLVYAWWRAPEPGAGAAIVAERRQLAAARSRGGLCDRAASFSSQIAFARLLLSARGQLQPGSPEEDRFAREAFAELVAHEVGHALGFPHNWKASLVCRWDDVRSGQVSGRRDNTPFSTSVMDYAPLHFAPRGKPQGDFCLQQLGAFDHLWVEYFYKPLDGLDPAARAAELDRIAARAEIERGLAYDDGSLGATDPTSNADDLGDDPLAFADARLRALRTEVLPELPELVRAEGHDDSLLRQALDAAIFSVAMDYIDMIARQVGGQVLWRRVASSPASPTGGPAPIEPVPADRQRQALAVLDEHLFADGALPIPPQLLQRLQADQLPDWNYPWRYQSDYDVGGRIAGLYDVALATLLEPARLVRILDNERRAVGNDRFTLPELFASLRRVAFTQVEPGADRRALQRLLVEHLVELAEGDVPGAPAEASQVALIELGEIRRTALAWLGRSDLGPYALAHFNDLERRADLVLDPRGGD